VGRHSNPTPADSKVPWLRLREGASVVDFPWSRRDAARLPVWKAISDRAMANQVVEYAGFEFGNSGEMAAQQGQGEGGFN